MLNCVIYIAVVILLIMLFYYYIKVINRETSENETEETKIVAGEFTNNIKNLQSDVIKKYLSDLQLKSKIDNIDQKYKDLETRLSLLENKKEEVIEEIIEELK
ncbi:hypothetical protein [Alphaentomopoxvirus acuprea]|uniref:Uncharacterized protein n=1 Tax=Alphaentomopoxvirus acuprea TaxID=62099 RepID=W6JIT8_9POXV|nr:hypothetical protein BA82_gp128 [Anomala cuprea entomopoxvirus]BAO49488.1 hypothetical protein [Anomala cuprea entomopoxvirus]